MILIAELEDELEGLLHLFREADGKTVLLCVGAEIMRPEADGAKALFDLLLCLHPHTPVRDLHCVGVHALCAHHVLAPGQDRSADAAGVGKERLGGLDGQKLSPVHDSDGGTHVVGLGAVMRHHQHFAPEAVEQVSELDFQRVAQMPVEGRERLVQKKQLRVADQDARQGDTLLLPAGELGRSVVFQSLQAHEGDHLVRSARLYCAVLFPAQAAEDVLPHAHVGE